MKNIIFAIAISAITLAACNSSSNKSDEIIKIRDSSTHVTERVSPFTSPVNDLLRIYLQMKNDFVNDDSKGAATTGKMFVRAINEFDKSILRDDEKKAFEDLTAHSKENAEHIEENAGDIKKQRKNFDKLSKNIYDLVKRFAAGERIYVEYCPMYNDKKGAIWLSETMEMKNPYFGNEMLTCGSITETIK
jgi:uncharacterized protein YhaN